MRPRPRRPLLTRATGLLAAALATVALHATGCLGTASCDALREKLLDERTTWSACDPAQGDAQCAIVAGDGTDCTGVFKCDFAVNDVWLAAAQKAVVDVASESPTCAAICSGITCAPDAPPRCDPIVRRCVIDVLNGAGSTTPPDQDAGSIPPVEIPDAAQEADQ